MIHYQTVPVLLTGDAFTVFLALYSHYQRETITTAEYREACTRFNDQQQILLTGGFVD
jgi:hypothetical protein